MALDVSFNTMILFQDSITQLYHHCREGWMAFPLTGGVQILLENLYWVIKIVLKIKYFTFEVDQRTGMQHIQNPSCPDMHQNTPANCSPMSSMHSLYQFQEQKSTLSKQRKLMEISLTGGAVFSFVLVRRGNFCISVSRSLVPSTLLC